MLGCPQGDGRLHQDHWQLGQGEAFKIRLGNLMVKKKRINLFSLFPTNLAGTYRYIPHAALNYCHSVLLHTALRDSKNEMEFQLKTLSMWKPLENVDQTHSFARVPH